MNRTPDQGDVLSDAREDMEKAFADAKQILEDTETFLFSMDLARRSSRSDNYEYDSEQYNRTREYMKTLLATVTDGPTDSSSPSRNQNLKVLNQIIAIGLNLMVPNEYTKRMLTSSSLHERYPLDPSVCLDPRYNNQIIPQWLRILPQELLPPIPPDTHIIGRASVETIRRRNSGKTQSPHARSRTRRKSAPPAPKANAVAHNDLTSEISPPPTPTRVKNVPPRVRNIVSPLAEHNARESRSEEQPCSVCYKNVRYKRYMIRAPCGRCRYCSICMARLVEYYIASELLHPLRCLCNVIIGRERVEPIIHHTRIGAFNEREQVYNTPEKKRCFCPNRVCKRFFKIGKLSSLMLASWKKTLQCPFCYSNICYTCRQLVHPGRKCDYMDLRGLPWPYLSKHEQSHCDKCGRLWANPPRWRITCYCGNRFCFQCGTTGLCGHMRGLDDYC